MYEDILVLSSQVGEKLQKHGMRLAVAESCTGGMLSSAVTAISGSSAWFDQGLISYSNVAKTRLLDVSLETLTCFGAVSQGVAEEMVQGVLSRASCHIAVAITGIAGPEGGSANKPVGTVWIAWGARGSQIVARSFHFHGSRNCVRMQAVYAALEGLSIMLEPACRDSAQYPVLQPPVITLDGASGVGKGTMGQKIAQKLGWHYLDSGLFFRVLAHLAISGRVSLADGAALSALAADMTFTCQTDAFGMIRVFVDNQDITDQVRSEICGKGASQVATLPVLRQVQVQKQRAFRSWPGLVADGRDMSSVVFKDACLKFFLYASLEKRAERRKLQLKKQGIDVNVENIVQSLQERDERDRSRKVAPLAQVEDSIFVDTTDLSAADVLSVLVQHVVKVFPPVLCTRASSMSTGHKE